MPSQPLKFNLLQPESSPDMVVVELSGQFTSADTSAFRSQIQALLEEGFHQIELDMRGVVYIDSSGLAEFVPAHRLAREYDATIRITHPRRLIYHIFSSAHLQEILEIGPPQENT